MTEDETNRRPEDLCVDDLTGGEVLTLKMEDYGFTGESWVRLADGWLSVRGAMPGERVRVRVEPAPGYPTRRRWATLLDVLSEHPARRPPLCEVDDICRGCQLRHMSVAEEARFKARTLREVLEKYADLPRKEQPEPELIAPQPWMRGDNWRIRTGLTYRCLDAHAYQLGLTSPATDALVPMSGCAALDEPVRRLVEMVEASLDELAHDGRLPADTREDEEAAREARVVLIRVASPHHGRGYIEVETDAATVPAAILEVMETIRRHIPEGVGLFVRTSEASVHHSGPEYTRLPVAGLQLMVTPSDWIHATLTPAHVLYDRLMEMIAPREGMRLLDVGCGIGTISLLAAKRGAHAVGIDINPDSVATAEVNALHHELLEETDFVAGGWEAALRRLTLAQQVFDVATINPMREPLGPRPLAYLEQLGVTEVYYLGPSPASAARDIGELRRMGWRLTDLGAAMLHPATYHVMLVGRLERA